MRFARLLLQDDASTMSLPCFALALAIFCRDHRKNRTMFREKVRLQSAAIANSYGRALDHSFRRVWRIKTPDAPTRSG
jgi:hypothetical protein